MKRQYSRYIYFALEKFVIKQITAVKKEKKERKTCSNQLGKYNTARN